MLGVSNPGTYTLVNMMPTKFVFLWRKIYRKTCVNLQNPIIAERCDTGERRKTNNWLCATAFCTPKELEDWSVYIDIAAELIDEKVELYDKWSIYSKGWILCGVILQTSSR